MRTFAHIRVSKERDDMISPGIQRDEIALLCAEGLDGRGVVPGSGPVGTRLGSQEAQGSR